MKTKSGLVFEFVTTSDKQFSAIDRLLGKL